MIFLNSAKYVIITDYKPHPNAEASFNTLSLDFLFWSGQTTIDSEYYDSSPSSGQVKYDRNDFTLFFNTHSHGFEFSLSSSGSNV